MSGESRQSRSRRRTEPGTSMPIRSSPSRTLNSAPTPESRQQRRLTMRTREVSDLGEGRRNRACLRDSAPDYSCQALREPSIPFVADSSRVASDSFLDAQFVKPPASVRCYRRALKERGKDVSERDYIRNAV